MPCPASLAGSTGRNQGVKSLLGFQIARSHVVLRLADEPLCADRPASAPTSRCPPGSFSDIGARSYLAPHLSMVDIATLVRQVRLNSGQVTIGSVSTSDDGREAILRRAATIDPCALKTDGGLVPLVSALASAYGIFATCTMVVTMEFRGLAGLAFRLAALAGLLFIRLSRSTDDATDYFQIPTKRMVEVGECRSRSSGELVLMSAMRSGRCALTLWYRRSYRQRWHLGLREAFSLPPWCPRQSDAQSPRSVRRPAG